MAKLYRNKNATGGTLSSNTSSTSSNSWSNATNTFKSNSKSWNTSKVSNKTKKALEQAETPFSSQYSDYLDKAISDINKREDFSYDLNADALYQQYANQYKALGEQAMNETIASASAMTGGYGNSYAVSAGQQAYNDYLQQLSDVAPDLYGQARDIYDVETNELYDKANMYAGLESEAYSRWATDRDYALTKENNEWNRNAVAHTSQTDKTTQTEKSGSSSTSSSSGSSTNYEKKTSSLILPSYAEIKDAVASNKKAEKNAQSLASTYGLDISGMLSKSSFNANGNKDNSGKSYDNYSTYVSKYLDAAINAAYSKKARKNSKNSKGSN